MPVIGNTSFTGVITPEGYITGEDGFVGIMAAPSGLEDLAQTLSAETGKPIV